MDEREQHPCRTPLPNIHGSVVIYMDQFLLVIYMDPFLLIIYMDQFRLLIYMDKFLLSNLHGSISPF